MTKQDTDGSGYRDNEVHMNKRNYSNNQNHKNNQNDKSSYMNSRMNSHMKSRAGRGFIIAAVFLIAAMGCIGGLWAKYRSEQMREAEMLAKDFHFSSNYLEEGKTGGRPDTTHVVSDWTDGITLELYNYEKENPALVSALAVEYTVTVSSAQFEVEDGSGTLAADTSDQDNFAKKTAEVTVRPKAGVQVTDTEFTVMVQTAPYNESLCATFQLTGKQNPEIHVTDDGTHYTARIYANHHSGDVTIHWPSNLIPDATNDLVSGWSGGSSTLTVDPFHTYEIVFFNPDGVTGLENSFTLG